MSENVRDIGAGQWQAYGQVYGFVGNELLTPMNRSGNLQGLDPAFWAAAPVPENNLGATGLARLAAYASAAAAAAEAGQPGESGVPGELAASVEFAHLFIGPPSPAATPWETTNDPANEGKVGFGRSTVAMRRLLAEEGLELAGQNNQYEDHLGIELLYLAALCDKAAAGTAAGAQAAEKAARTAEGAAAGAGACAAAAEGTAGNAPSERAGAPASAAEKAAWFLDAHPLSWIGRLRANVDASRPDGYYSALLQYAHGILEDHAASLRA